LRMGILRICTEAVQCFFKKKTRLITLCAFRLNKRHSESLSG